MPKDNGHIRCPKCKKVVLKRIEIIRGELFCHHCRRKSIINYNVLLCSVATDKATVSGDAGKTD
jgi:hypothetical protein